MSAASVTAYLAPTMARKRAISSGESGGAEGCTIFILVSCWCSFHSFPCHRGTAQPVIDGFAELVPGHRHDRDTMRALGVEGAKIAEKIGGGLVEIAACGQIHHRPRRVNSRHRGGTERQQRLAGLDAGSIQPQGRTLRVM